MGGGQLSRSGPPSPSNYHVQGRRRTESVPNTFLHPQNGVNILTDDMRLPDSLHDEQQLSPDGISNWDKRLISEAPVRSFYSVPSISTSEI